MFIGHFGIGLGAKAVEPKVSLGALFLAAQFIDLLWPSLLLLGVEHVAISPGITNVAPLDFVHYPISHSLLMSMFWGVVVGGLFYLVRKNRKGAVLLGLLVVSHWFLDLIVHRPDLPLAPGVATKVGLGLWYSFAGTLVVEGILFIAGASLYLKKTTAKNNIGKWGAWSLFALLIIIHIGNLWGPAPEQLSDIAWVGQLQWLFVIFAFWIDKNRMPFITPSPGRPATLKPVI